MKIILKKFLRLASLFEAQVFYIHKAAMVIIVYKDKNFILAVI